MDELKYNAEHYRDKTAQKAVRQADYEAEKHRVDMLVKELRKVQAYCAEHPRGCRGCALLNFWGGCKLRSRPAVWDLDGAGYLKMWRERND